MNEMRKFYVYIMASKKEGVLYIGVTDDIKRRGGEHKDTIYEGFTKEYFVRRLVYFEIHPTAEEASKREKLMKKWKRDWKIQLVEKHNPEWVDIYDSIPGSCDVRIPAFAGI
ncbi:MAG: GIY-YIG nuclease family protein [Rickettsiales bacterium]|jgi:putative endonuclease|nr:GIY-YIG nuclease family protein [Rickettsiales bacterium]